MATAAPAPRLRELGVGEILDVGIKIFFRHAGTLIRVVLVVVVPAQIITNLVVLSGSPAPVGGFGTNFQTQAASNHDTAIRLVGFAIALVVGALGGKLAQGAAFKAISDAYLGERPEWRSSLVYALKRLPSLVWIAILGGIATAIGVVFCVIPGVYLWVGFSVAVPVLLLEDQRGTAALGRSRRLVSGRWWGTFGVLLVGSVLTSVFGAVIAALVGAVSAAGGGNVVTFVVSTFAGSVAAAITTPIYAAFVVVLYIDLRVRKEGFDLMLLAQRLGVERAEPAQADLLPPAFDTEGEQPPFWPPPPGWKPGGSSEP